MRRGRISDAIRVAALADLTKFDLSIDEEGERHAWSNTLHLADRFLLTLYDATYPELAQRRTLPLATLDKELRSAAQTLQLPLMGLK
jgi:predicted nucleic acid-binding protein